MAGESNRLSTYDYLDLVLWATKHSRFIGAARLKNQHHFSSVSIAILSIYVLGLSISTSIGFLADKSHIINFINILSSVAILVLSLIESNNNYSLRAHYLQESGNEISNLLVRLKITSDFPSNIEQNFLDISEKYKEILEKCPENHSQIDYMLALSRHEKVNWFISTLLKLAHYSWAYTFYPLIVFSPPIILYAYIH